MEENGINETEVRPIVVGLDIGTTKICVIVGRPNEYGKIDILGVGKVASTGVQKGVVNNIQQTTENIKAAVEEASLKSNVKIEVVHVGIAGQHIRAQQMREVIVRNNSHDQITQKDIDRLIADVERVVKTRNEEIIHIIPQDYIVDEEIGVKQPIGMAGVRFGGNFHIITGSPMAAQNIVRCIKGAGLESAGLILEPLASAAAVLGHDEMEAGVVLVDIGGGTTDIAIFQDNIIRHSSVIALAGNKITEDIQEGCNIMKGQAEELKVKFGCALASEASKDEFISIPGIRGRAAKEISMYNLAMIIQARLEEIFAMIMHEIEESGFARKLSAGMVITGGGSQLKHMAHLVNYLTGMDARIGLPDEHLSKGLIREINSPIYATGTGLILKGLELLHDQEMADAGEEEAKVASSRIPTAKKAKSWLDGLMNTSKKLFEDDMDDYK